MTAYRRLVALLGLMIGTGGCAGESTEPGLLRERLAAPPVRISELHYDNVGADVDERIEVSGPAGTDLTGWTLALYNGSGGAVYDTLSLSGSIPASCSDRGVVVVSAVGIQNGSPDGLALVEPGGIVVEFLSYEGTMTATSGSANGLTSIDIGVSEGSSNPMGESLARQASGGWSASAPNTFGSCNDNGGTPPAEVASVVVSPSSATLFVGATTTLTATALDAASQPVPGATFTWQSSDSSVAVVSANGVVTAAAPGDASIAVTAPNGASATASIHVDAPVPPSVPDTRLSEIHYDNSGVDSGEAIEIEGPAGTDLTGWSLVLYDGTPNLVDGLRRAYNTQTLTGTIPSNCGERGVRVIEYASNGIQNGSPDGIALVDAMGVVVEFLSYEGALTADDGPAAGLTSVDIVAQEASSASVAQSLQRNASNQWATANRSFGVCNSEGPPPVANSLFFTGRVPTDPPLPVGYQDQLFATLRSPDGVTIPSSFVWSSEAPELASIDADGVMTALAAGTATLRATAADGTTATYSLPTRVAAAGSAIYAGHAEFGEPVDADSSDDFIVRHAEYTASYNPTRGTPNWVAYDLEATHFGNEDRCDCFTFDPALPLSFVRYTTADYTGAGAYHGFGIDRGHLVRSFDRTSGSLDNANTFYFTNVVPQAADLNQGPWAMFENELGDRARFQDKEVYVIAGVAGNRGTLKDQGKIVIPTSTWKVAIVMPPDHGLAHVTSYPDLEVLAVNMPNEPGIRNVPWQTYLTTVDAVESLSGYDLLALLADRTEAAVESGSSPPLGHVDGPYAAQEGAVVVMSATGSVDPNGSVVSYLWSFGDGSSASGEVASHVYAQDGTYTVQLTVTDNDGLTDTVVTSASIAPVLSAPTIQDAIVLFDSLTFSGALARPAALLLRRELVAAQRDLERGRPRVAAVRLSAVSRQLEGLVRLRALSAAEVAPLRALLATLILDLTD